MSTANSISRSLIGWTLAVLLGVGGCAGPDAGGLWLDAELAHYKDSALQIEYPEIEALPVNDFDSVPAPISLSQDPQGYWDMSLSEAIQTALSNSQVLRDLGGLIVQAPENVQTRFGPALTDSDPIFGTEAALSAFDASFETSLFFEKNDRPLNNVFFGGGTRLLKQDLHAYQAQLSKTTATGGNFAIRKLIDYDQNNSPGNADPNLPWTVQLEGEFRQPLLQGAGVDFNQIAGPNATPGALNGVLIARINTDKSLADFEIGVRNLVNDVENAYWELYFAYRDLDSKRAARDRARDVWRTIHALAETGRRGGEADKEAKARGQLNQLELEVQNAIAGRPQDRIRTTTFRGVGGVHTAERRLRLLLGIQANDGRLIRPAEEPPMARVLFVWEEILAEALSRRAELRRQKWQIRRSELAVLASRNFLLPRVDAVGRYRYRGLGDDLLNSSSRPPFDNAFQELTGGNYQEWQVGLEVIVPVGYRRAHTALRNAELALARDRALLLAQQQDVVHDLSAARAEIDRAHSTMLTSYNYRQSVIDELKALEANYENADEQDKIRQLDRLMDAQRRLADAESDYFRSLVEHTIAVKNVHLSKGSLLEYNEVILAEGPWPDKAYHDADQRERNRRDVWRVLDHVISRPAPLASGRVPQRLLTADVVDDSPIGVPTPADPYEQDTLPEPSIPQESRLAPPAVPQDHSAFHPGRDSTPRPARGHEVVAPRSRHSHRLGLQRDAIAHSSDGQRRSHAPEEISIDRSELVPVATGRLGWPDAAPATHSREIRTVRQRDDRTNWPRSGVVRAALEADVRQREQAPQAVVKLATQPPRLNEPRVLTNEGVLRTTEPSEVTPQVSELAAPPSPATDHRPIGSSSFSNVDRRTSQVNPATRAVPAQLRKASAAPNPSEGFSPWEAGEWRGNP